MLDRNSYFIREHVGLFKLKDAYDILDPTTNEHLGHVVETTPPWILYLRLLLKKAMMPVSLEIRSLRDDALVLRIARGWTFWRSKVHISDAHGQALGYFESKLVSMGGGFHVYTTSGVRVAEIKGDWKGWNFHFLSATGEEIGVVTKKWAGLGKELFTTADNYLISLHSGSETPAASSALLLAAGLAIDTVYNEQG